LFIRVGRGEKDCAHTFDENIEVDASWPLLLASAVNTLWARQAWKKHGLRDFDFHKTSWVVQR
jgi:hypothetical protein